MPNEQLAAPVEVDTPQDYVADQPVDDFAVDPVDRTAEVTQMPLTRVQVPVHEGQSDVALAHEYARSHPGWQSAGILEGDGGRFVIFERQPEPASSHLYLDYK